MTENTISQQVVEAEQASARIARLRRWRRISGYGGLVLASAFFMPAINSCNAPITPYQEWMSLSPNTPRGMDLLAGLCFAYCCFAAAYLFGLICFGIAWRGGTCQRYFEKHLGLSVPILLGSVIGAFLLGTIYEAATNNAHEWDVRDYVIYINIPIVSVLWLWGLFICLESAIQQTTCRRISEKHMKLFTLIPLGSVTGSLMIALIDTFMTPDQPGNDIESYIYLAIFLVASIYWFYSLHTDSEGLLAIRWFTACCCVLWFGLWGIDYKDTYYGLWVSLAGSVIILISTTAEAKIHCRTGFWRTIWNLMRCRLQLANLAESRCFECGYLLIGLTSGRCPECGTTIPADQSVPPSQDARLINV